MKIDILTLFPNMFDGFLNESIIKRAIDSFRNPSNILGNNVNMFDGFLNESIIKRAIDKGLVEINIINFRDYTHDPHNKVDDTPYGGGAGMVLMIEPIYNALMAIKKDDSHVILLSPSGKTFDQKKAKALKDYKHLIIICGHYEGFDARIKNIIDEEISIGDFILTGGELPAMMITDSVIRLIPGVISKESLENESFDTELLDYPVYTKPRVFKGMEVPEVLLNGDHKKIEEYRNEERKRITLEKNNKE